MAGLHVRMLCSRGALQSIVHGQAGRATTLLPVKHGTSAGSIGTALRMSQGPAVTSGPLSSGAKYPPQGWGAQSSTGQSAQQGPPARAAKSSGTLQEVRCAGWRRHRGFWCKSQFEGERSRLIGVSQAVWRLIVAMRQHFTDDTGAEHPSYTKPIGALRLCMYRISLYGLYIKQ
jgi:hypothetical protein